ncbi:MAG TPA: DinB family protein [Thermoanaerobaculia bacterium]|nr:DinB family protein [Thermoanaerobaculia bacterium]
MNKTFRRGVIGALVDEFERATAQLAELVLGLTDAELEAVRDRETQDDDCRSIQTVVNHVVRAGYGHTNYIRLALAIDGSRPDLELGSRAESVEQLAAMLSYLETTFEGRWEITEKETAAVEIHARWGPTFDLEQMLEHAIVHVLRHRRQIERFLTEPRFAAGDRPSPPRDFSPANRKEEERS